MRKTIIAVCVVVVLAVLAWVLASRDVSVVGGSGEERIKQEIAEANYCETVADCSVVVSQCPFGCYVGVNKSEAARIEALITGYESTCIYSCIELRGVDCVNSRCEILN